MTNNKYINLSDPTKKMSFLSNLIFKLAYFVGTIGYPGFKVYKDSKAGKSEKIWVLYFLIYGILSILEGTALFPIIYM